MPVLNDPQSPPPNDATIIWKYFNKHSGERALREGTLWQCSLSDFDDKFEASLTWMDENARASAINGMSVDSATQAQLLDFNRIYLDNLSHYMCASCWIICDGEDLKMWSDYAGDGGMAVKTTVGRLRSVLSPSELVLNLGKVNYRDFSSESSDLYKNLGGGNPNFAYQNNMILPLTKSDAFKSERELRLWTYHPSFPREQATVQQLDKPSPAGFALPVNWATLAEEVRVNPTASPAEISGWRAIARGLPILESEHKIRR